MSQADGSTVLFEVEDGIATITMNRPEARNALSRALQNDLAAAFARADADDDVRVVILTGAGVAFTAGVDLKEFGQTGGRDDGERASPARSLWSDRRRRRSTLRGHHPLLAG